MIESTATITANYLKEFAPDYLLKLEWLKSRPKNSTILQRVAQDLAIGHACDTLICHIDCIIFVKDHSINRLFP